MCRIGVKDFDPSVIRPRVEVKGYARLLYSGVAEIKERTV